MIQARTNIPSVGSADIQDLRVLVIDDDDATCRRVQGLLQHHGCAVMTASNPVKALEVFSRQEKPIQLVLLDYCMPLLDGGKTLEWLRKINPGVRVILCTSAEELRLRQLMRQLPLDGCLHKPLRLPEALAAIQDVMARPVRQA